MCIRDRSTGEMCLWNFAGLVLALVTGFYVLQTPLKGIPENEYDNDPLFELSNGDKSDFHEIIINTGELKFSAIEGKIKDHETSKGTIIFLHGFPDNYHTFKHQMEYFNLQGYHVLAPLLRGYEPSSQPKDNDFALINFVSDILKQMDVLGITKAHLVGHDWGAVIAFLAQSVAPDRFVSVTSLSIPNPSQFLDATFKVPYQLYNSWYFYWFQIPYAPELWLKSNNFQGISKFFEDWSTRYSLERVENIKKTFNKSGIVESAIAIYKQNIFSMCPGWADYFGSDTQKQTYAAVIAKRPKPTLMISGEEDGCVDTRVFTHATRAADFEREYKLATVGNAGHWVHLSQPHAVNELIENFLQTCYNLSLIHI
eukprot:TRINITY_DN4174_c0_g1_i1.p1 TRINITY_DN4174_c0_g1~~TRINITY_DN4174_c0_g1_i1.p1  ORF type:complete len:369 (-),score=65.49 TRINITY_DN4174_c0_g1_i1:29-1135(-)